uniref:Cytochrome c biogenesis protein CcsA n=1 Tax=Rhodogorgon sp. TaxID=2485824 RepID=A0A3G3MI62_9FLOR|nr:cytochrome c biogenesis protein [Rhodogorgon sp.]
MNWNLFQNYLVNASFGLSLITLIIYWFGSVFPKIKNTQIIGQIGTLLINIFLTLTLLSRWITDKYFPLSNLYESLLFLAWSLTFIHIFLEKQNRSKLIGAISTPINLFIITFASFCLPPEMQQAAPLVPALQSNWLMMHVTIMMISYATLMFGSLLSILFLIIAYGENIERQDNLYNYNRYKKSVLNSTTNNNNLKHKYRLNSNEPVINYLRENNRLTLLESIDNLSYRTIGLGFPLLTIGIIAGAVWANEAWGSYWSWDPKETWALITWLIFASYLHSRLAKEWQGKKPAILASVGFFIIWICYLGVNFLGKGLHTYGWLS